MGSPSWLLAQSPGALDHLANRATVEERFLRQVVVLPGKDRLESPDRRLAADVLAVPFGVRLGDEEQLDKEALDLSRPR